MSLSTSVAVAEDVLMALIEYFVAPMLPLSSSVRDPPPPISLEESVAKQVHAVVLLYGYYYRKQHPEVEYLGFKPFCQLAVVIKPTLMAHMKLMHHSEFGDLDDLENRLSVTEKAVMDALNISSALNPSQSTPNTESWEVSKVAVLLIDSNRENCVLKNGTITQGVWSVIEKNVPDGRHDGEVGKHISKRRRSTKKSRGDGMNIDKAGLQNLALSAVTEAIGINHGDLVVLDSHTVYSLSKEKSAVQFYIVQSTVSIDEELKPITNVIESLQGPLVEKRSGRWAITPVVEYFHLLPYVEIIEEWFSREVISNQDLLVEMQQVDVESSEKVGDTAGNEDLDCKTIVERSADMQSYGTDNTLYLKHQDNTGIGGIGLHNINDQNSEMPSNLSVKVYEGKDNDSTKYVANGCSQTHSQVFEQKNDVRSAMVSQSDSLERSGNLAIAENFVKAGEIKNADVKRCAKIDNISDNDLVQKNKNVNVTDCKSDSLGGSRDNVFSDCSIVYCRRAAKSDDHGLKSCQIIDDIFYEEVSKDKLKFNEKKKATGSKADEMSAINANPFKQITDNGVNHSGLQDFYTDLQPIDTDETSLIDNVCNYELKYENMTDCNERIGIGTNAEFSKQISDNRSDLNRSATNVVFSAEITDNGTYFNRSETDAEFSRQITDSGTDVSDFPDGHISQKGMSGINAESSKQIKHDEIAPSALPNCHAYRQTMDDDASMIDIVCANDLQRDKITFMDSDEIKPSGATVELAEPETDKVELSNCQTDQQNRDTDGSLMIQNGIRLSNGCIITKVYSHKKRRCSSKTNTNAKKGDANVKVEIDDSVLNVSVPKSKDGKTDKGKETLSITCSDQVKHAIVPYQLNADDQDKLQVTQDSEQNSLSQTALMFLQRKQSKLTHQKRLLEDEIAVCDKLRQSILEGGESELTSQMEAIIEACYGSLKSESDAGIPSRSSCQELDDICHSNFWTLPTYQLYPVDGSFWASIKLKGGDFEFSEDGDLCVKPSLARESAAGKMIPRLQCLTGQNHKFMAKK